MIRMLLLLCAAIFVVLALWGGEDAPRRVAATPAAAPAAEPMVVQASYISEAPAPTGPVVPLVLPLVRSDAAVVEALSDAPAPAETEAEIRYITASSVNVREGPSTEFPVVGKLSRGEAARLLWTEENGWARIILEGDGMTGFVSGDFLSDSAP